MAGVTDATQPDVAKTDIQIILSGGRTLRRSVHPDDTLGALVDDLRRNGHLMGVSNIRVITNDSLMTTDNWRHSTMAEIRALSGQPVQITTFRPAALQISKFYPDKSSSVKQEVLKIDEKDSANVDTMKKLLQKFQTLDIDTFEPSAFTTQCLSLYSRDGKTRRAVKSFDPNSRKFFFVDEISGEEEVQDQRSYTIITFLSGGSGLIAAASKSLIPSLRLYAKSEVLSIDSNSNLQPAFRKELLFPTSYPHLVLMRGLRKSTKNGVTLAMALWLHNHKYLDVNNGTTYTDEDNAAAAMSNMDGNLTHTFILASASSLLPQYSIPQGMTVDAMTLSGWQVTVVGRQLTGKQTTHPDSGSLWVSPSKVSQFHRQLTQAMTR